MSESPKDRADGADEPIAPRSLELTLAQIELQRRAHRLLEHGTRPRMSIADIQKITSVFHPQSPQTEPDWLLPPDLTLFYARGDAPLLATDNMKRYILESLRAHDAVFILGMHKNIPIPQGWITALESLKLKLAPDIDFDFVFVPSSTNETFGRLYVDEHSLAIPLVHDKNMCTTDDALIHEVEKCIATNASPIHKRRRAIQKEAERVSAISQEPELSPIHEPEPTPPCIVSSTTRSLDPVEGILQKWDAQYRAEVQETRKIHQRIITSSSR
ncbi:MAG: hypothetical protein NTX63_03035 [Candidatus Peregrinibacteria bacterium]|nr:hypothetical protein [Candidatus Peregrinibacteria bacterium]